MAAVQGREGYRVGDLVVDLGTQRVTGPAGDIVLPKLSFDAFVALLRHAPDFVSNDELSAQVWGAIVVSPETVTKRVNLLREALGDDAANPRYIAGMRSRGYRIIAPVTPLIHDTEPARATETAPPASARARTAWIGRLAAVAIAVAVLVAVGVWVVRTGRGPAPVAAQTAEPAEVGLVAVLPFENLSPSPSDAYLATGVPQMVLDRLAKVPGLSVVAGSSAFGIDTHALDPAEIGQRLGVRFLVAGSTQRAGDELRVAARLIDATTGTQVWSTHIDRKVDDIFAIQDAIAEQVATELARRTGARPMPDDAGRYKPPIEAQLAYLKGQVLLARHTIVDARAAAEHFATAIRVDPGFAAALAGMFDARMLAAERAHEDVAAEFDRQLPLIERAVSIDPNCGQAYLARAIWSRADAARRDADFRRGLTLDPSNGRGLVAYAEFLDKSGRPAEAERFLERALMIDPMSPRAHFWKVIREFDRSGAANLEAGMRRVLELDPDYQPALQRNAKYRWMLHGDLVQAAQFIEHAIAVDPENPWSRHTAAAIYLDLGDEATARKVAAATASSRASSQLLLGLYTGDWRTAGEVALSQPGQQYNLSESWGAPEAVRDYAMNTGEYARAIRFLETRYGLGEGGQLGLPNFRAAACLAQLLQATGQGDRAKALLDALPAAIDATLAKYGTVPALRTKAMVYALRGEREAALATLTESFRSDDLMQWWYTLEHDPLWRPMRGDPAFRALATEVRARVARERAALAAARQSAATARSAASDDSESH